MTSYLFFAAELEDSKIGMWGKGLSKEIENNLTMSTRKLHLGTESSSSPYMLNTLPKGRQIESVYRKQMNVTVTLKFALRRVEKIVEKGKQEGHDGPVSLHWLIREIPSYQTIQYMGIGLKHKTPNKD